MENLLHFCDYWHFIIHGRTDVMKTLGKELEKKWRKWILENCAEVHKIEVK